MDRRGTNEYAHANGNANRVRLWVSTPTVVEAKAIPCVSSLFEGVAPMSDGVENASLRPQPFRLEVLRMAEAQRCTIRCLSDRVMGFLTHHQNKRSNPCE